MTCALDSPKIFRAIPIEKCTGSYEQYGFPFQHACDNSKNNSNGWAFSGRVGSQIKITFKGSYYISRVEIQSGVGHTDHQWKEFNMWFKAHDIEFKLPENVIVTADGLGGQIGSIDDAGKN